LAQPPTTTTTPTDIFLREVDENLRRDRASEFAKRYGNWLIAALVLFLAAAGGWIYWQNVREQRAERQVEELAEIYRNISTGATTAAAQPLAKLGTDGSSASVRASAQFTVAAIALQNNDQPAALAKYSAIAGEAGYPQPYRDAAIIRQSALEFDRIKPEDLIARLAPLAKPGNPWFGSAGEMTALALIKQGKNADAGKLFAAIAKDKNVPDTIRARSVQIAASLGIDASGALGS
jgi:hypothetical protein